ncbi:MAG TPA: retropepsin-like aspartic protease [Chryseolinea sp.]
MNINLSCKWILLFLTFATYAGYGRTIIPIEINDGGYIFIKVTLNGGTDARFMLDTGAGVNVISKELFEKIRSTLKEEGLHTGIRHNGEQITGMLYRLPELSIGSFSKQHVTIGIYERLNDFDGLLSLDYFRETPFTIDFVTHQLIIEESTDLAAIRKTGVSIPVTLQKKGNHEIEFFVDVCFDNSVRCSAEFDTGAGFNMLMLHPAYIKKLNLKVPSESVNYGYYVYSTTLPVLTYCANPEKLINKNVFVGFKDGLIYDGLVGSGMFRTRRLTINVPGSEMVAH